MYIIFWLYLFVNVDWFFGKNVICLWEEYVKLNPIAITESFFAVNFGASSFLSSPSTHCLALQIMFSIIIFSIIMFSIIMLCIIMFDIFMFDIIMFDIIMFDIIMFDIIMFDIIMFA